MAKKKKQRPAPGSNTPGSNTPGSNAPGSNAPAQQRRQELLDRAAELGIPDVDSLDLPTLEAVVDDAAEERVTIDVPQTVTTLAAITIAAGTHTMTVTELAASGLQPRHYTRVED